jgi:hypothetical protein
VRSLLFFFILLGIAAETGDQVTKKKGLETLSILCINYRKAWSDAGRLATAGR